MSSFFLLTNLVLLYHFCSRPQEDLGKKRRDPALRPSLFFSEERKLLKWKWKELAHEIPNDPGGVFPGYFFNLIVGEAIPVELVKEEANLLKFKAVFKNAFAYRISNQQSAFSSFNCPEVLIIYLKHNYSQRTDKIILSTLIKFLEYICSRIAWINLNFKVY